MTLFVDTSTWFAAIVKRDRNNARAKAIISSGEGLVTTDHVMIETWLLLKSRYHYRGAQLYWERVRYGSAHVEMTTAGDLEVAWATTLTFPDQEFSLVDRTSFAAMERLGLTRVASFDRDFAIYRYGRNRERAFEVLR